MGLIVVDGVTFRIGRHEILKDVSLHIEAGAFVGLIGPNGAGKSTLMRAAAGLIQPTAGEVHFENRPLRALGAKERARRIALVSQNPGMGFGFTVRDVVAMGRYAHQPRFAAPSSADQDAVAAAMDTAGISTLKERRITTLSGGERQRVFLARALAQNPRLLLLDEPTANLDIRYQLELLTLIRDLNVRKGLTVLMAVHDLSLVLNYCTTLAVMHEGRLISVGVPAEVLTPALISDVFGVDARVPIDPATGRPTEVVYTGVTSPMR